MNRIQTISAPRPVRVIAAAVGAALILALAAPKASAADTQILFVHGYGSAAQGKDCNGSTWKNALRYYQRAGGRERSSMTTLGYYAGTEPGECDVLIGDGAATNDRPIDDIAQDLADYIYGGYTSQGKPVDIVAHSMGGLISRVALLGSAHGWTAPNGEQFPPKLNVDDVVTLGTPHQGVSNPSAHGDVQWRDMAPGSALIGGLHEDDRGLDDAWASGTEWSLIGSKEDGTVSYDSGIDKGFFADQKFGFQDARDSGNVSHTGIRTLFGENRYALRYWHASGNHPPHNTRNGWSPLKAAFQAATRSGDGLPR
jgi:triacylglycerol esterase/lipase EstA (alpha/beta hydrolase family)